MERVQMHPAATYNTAFAVVRIMLDLYLTRVLVTDDAL